MNKVVLFLLLSIGLIAKGQTQNDSRAISTAAPFLLITPDARAGGMGDVGVATSSDAFSIHHNPAKIAFNNAQYSIGVNYTPWMRNLVNDVFLGGFSFVNRLNERSSWGVNFKYFTLGEIQLTDRLGAPTGVEKPNDLSLDGSYSLKLSETFSMGVTLRYLRSDLSIQIEDSELVTFNSFGVDISGYYQSEEASYGDFNGRFRGGFNISNIGPKVTRVLGGEQSFIPTNMRLGGGFDFIMDDFNQIGLTLEFTKLLVPTPPVRESGVIVDGQDDNVGWIQGIFQSFGDAPGGFSEEIKEFTWALGAEYLYNQSFAVRAGYFNESELKGSRKYFTMGAGFSGNAFSIDVSYLINSSDVNNPLDNTLRFSLAFDLGELYENY